LMGWSGGLGPNRSQHDSADELLIRQPHGNGSL
jgi:hypothetical protein